MSDPLQKDDYSRLNDPIFAARRRAQEEPTGILLDR